jgi:hypothetical protein
MEDRRIELMNWGKIGVMEEWNFGISAIGIVTYELN